MQKGWLWVRPHEKGGKDHEMHCHHNLETYLNDYIERCSLRDISKGFLFRTTGRKRVVLTPRGEMICNMQRSRVLEEIIRAKLLI